MITTIKSILYQASMKISERSHLMYVLIPLLGRWLIFALAIPFLLGFIQSVKYHRWRIAILYLCLLAVYGILFAVMVALTWEVICYKLGVGR